MQSQLAIQVTPTATYQSIETVFEQSQPNEGEVGSNPCQRTLTPPSLSTQTPQSMDSDHKTHGTRVARVRAIFNLPKQFGSLPHPLAYVEWYTPLRRKDPETNLYLVSRSTRNGKPNASIVSLDKIRRAAHLIPKYGRKISRDLTKDNALDVATEFRVNSYISVDLRTSQPS
ncbi:uncharacterized protein B0H18DRAFT_955019 [Fomitopsis serialis]|uniref:uncharacterized protein n=1 Tax=Fomitopsis serialis TaxID=139415 RepID=UPI00200733E5|nr:uncharacterized protein B0H18DRAFT_955019 [Neoantrodia serialis]KAH9925840.1 hypothetical protein B0H18DRAFT_955019 [Neoantrodia serialis]